MSTSPTRPTRTGAYPGSFNPPTIAHLAIAEAAREQRGLDRVDLVVSQRALGKEHVEVPSFEDRMEVLRASVAEIDWLQVIVTPDQLLVDIAEGYDVLIMGADKWFQIQEPRFYDSPADRDSAIARLPELAIAARAQFHGVPEHAHLDVSAEMLYISSTGARSGRRKWMTDAAQDWAARNNGWGY